MKTSIIVFFISLLLIASKVNSTPQSPTDTDEIQILIDVSGSMKQNDPQNLRADAAQLIINLLPDNAKVSIWLFAEKTTLLSHSDAVDKTWRTQAAKTSQSIHSRGIYTHIEDAIQTTLKQGFSGNGNKNLILLTDGMVDISKDIMVSADSRERILSEWLPTLRQKNIKVQTIGLSEQTDKELLEKLAFETGGWHETAESAEQLQRLFLKTAQKVAPQDTLPLNDNKFSIDNSIKEFSIVVFKKAGAPATQLIAPDQQKLNKKTDSKTLFWLESSGYDLITLKQPIPGEWQLEASADPDNQVMILTDLKLQIDELNNFIAEKQSIPLKLHFTEQDKIITHPDFLSLVNLTLSIDHQDPINIPAIATEPGFFSRSLNELPKGKHQLTIIADGKTFQREINQDIEVVTSPITLEKLIDAENRQISLKFQPDISQLDSSSVAITAIIHKPNLAAESQLVEEQDGVLQLKLPVLAAGETMLINFNITAKTLDGSSVAPLLPPISIDDSFFAPPAPAVSPVEPQASLTPEVADATQAQPETEVVPAEVESNWGITIAIVLTVNLLLGGMGFFIYKKLKIAHAKKQQQILERLA
ncbi:hypothetical protein A1359_06820 [Methylomonas lenta]|uniref:VWFA domain-containing protein n=1 Tax=Methylomonas lenta TaxID=980561 RepID=A0A177NI51_9GAMM|nr:vWA domain-containing protein [Methylomonas lenta]OAI16899.1 hypothetical protein A1359_06820 [Methylomonas lenta]